jgi:uncharacterized coiled-coil DUF342 family protein
MSKRDDYVRKMHSKLDEWNADIDRLAAKAGEIKAEARAEYDKQIQDLRSKRADAKKKLEDAEKAGEDAWEDLKGGLELAWKAVGEAFDSAKSRFRS